MTFAEAGVLFAQAGRGGGGGGAGGGEAIVGIIFMVGGFVVAAAIIACYIMYLITLSKALQECSDRNRTMEPGQVWLNLIPCFNLVWIFITVTRIAESLENEYRDRGMRADGDYGKTIGIVTYVLACVSIIPFVNYIASPAYLICWIIYWVKIAGLTRQLREGGGERDADEDDRRPSRRSSRRDDDEEEERPSKRRARDEDEEEDRPSKRRRDDDEDEDDRPSKRRRRDDD